MEEPYKNTPVRQRKKAGIEEVNILPLLRSISIFGLFGKYDYPQIITSDVGRKLSNVSFLYGENGAGKTTILKLIYCMLSTERNAGNRGYLGTTKFNSINLCFLDGQEISIVRPRGQNIGNFKYILQGPRLNTEFPIKVNESGRVTGSENPQLDDFCSRLDSILPVLVFVNDHRTIRSSYQAWDVRGILNKSLRSNAHWTKNYVLYEDSVRSEIDLESLSSSGLDRLLQQAQNQLVERAILGNVRANVGAGQVYLTVAKAIAKSRDKDVRSSTGDAQKNLLDRIGYLEKQVREFGRFGLIQGDYLGEIRDVFLGSRDNVKDQINDIIEPYISSIEQRVDSNLELMKQMAQFERGVNRFLKRKHLLVSIGDNLKIVDDDGEPLEPANLSSGERHLLYLCTVALLSRHRQSLVLVDEPELSLNYKWQRALVDSLTSIAGEFAQFVMATHSFEIISRYRDSASEVEPRQ